MIKAPRQLNYDFRSVIVLFSDTWIHGFGGKMAGQVSTWRLQLPLIYKSRDILEIHEKRPVEKAASRAVVMFKAFWTIYYSTTVLTVHGKSYFRKLLKVKKMPTMTFRLFPRMKNNYRNRSACTESTDFLNDCKKIFIWWHIHFKQKKTNHMTLAQQGKMIPNC
jgi:hypothetical protein